MAAQEQGCQPKDEEPDKDLFEGAMTGKVRNAKEGCCGCEQAGNSKTQANQLALTCGIFEQGHADLQAAVICRHGKWTVWGKKYPRPDEYATVPGLQIGKVVPLLP